MFLVCFVCTGNRCRSPFGAKVFEAMTSSITGVRVVSVGTIRRGGASVPPELITVGRGVNLDLSSHRSRYLTEENLAEVDLTLGFEHAHVASAVVDGGARADRSFSVMELARLLRTIQPPNHGDPLMNARDAVARANLARAKDRRFVAGEDVADPFGKSVKDYETSASQIVGLCGELVTGFFGIEMDQT